MKLAIIGSRSITDPNIEEYLPDGVTEIVSGGAKGIDEAAARYAKQNGIKLTEFLPDYERYGRAAPIVRNKLIAEYADECLAFWDSWSHGTKYTIECFRKLNKPVEVIV